MRFPQSSTVRATAGIVAGIALTLGGAGVAVAATGAATTTVNIRSGPSTSHAVKARLVRGQRVTVTGTTGAWARISLGGSRAYVAKRYLDTTGSLPAAPTRISTAGPKVATESLNVRTGPSTRYRIAGRLRAGSRVSVTGPQRGGFAQVRFAGHARWVSVAYLARARGRATTAVRPHRSHPARASRTSAAKGRAALAFARRQLGKPYVWGAEGPHSYDCSGLTQSAWRSVGVLLPRTARQQYAQGRKISRSQLRAGDLVFFYGPIPSHVGLYVGGGRIIDAPRPGKTVRYTTLTYMPYAGAVRPR